MPQPSGARKQLLASRKTPEPSSSSRLLSQSHQQTFRSSTTAPRHWGSLITICLPKLVMQLVGLLLKLCVKHSVMAATTVATQAVEEIGGAGQYVVTALEEALDIPAAVSSTGGIVQAAQAASAPATLHAAQAMLKEGIGESNTSAAVALVDALATQLQSAPPPQPSSA